MRWSTLGMVLAIFLAGIMPLSVDAHGFAGKRFFPTPLTVDDPFAADELNLLLTHQPSGEAADVTGATLKFSKRFTERLSLSLEGTYTQLDPATGPTRNGFRNIEIGARFMGPVSAERESVVAIGLDVEIGGTGDQALSKSFSVISPAFFLGQGFGNLPQSAKYLRPLAFTTAIAYNWPTRDSASETLFSGFTLQYNFAYLASSVGDVSLPGWLRHAVVLIEAPLRFCLDESERCGYDMIGTINPGVIWFNSMGQIGIEAVIPVNNHSGDSVGVLLQVQLYLSHWLPQSLGNPLFD